MSTPEPDPPPSVWAWLNYVWLLAVGLLVGVTGTVAHRHTGIIFGIAVPWGLVLALFAVLALLLAARLRPRGRGYALAAGLGVLVSVGMLSLPAGNGSVLIGSIAGSNDQRGMIWLLGTTVIIVIIALWPRLPRRTTYTGEPDSRREDS